MASKTVTEIIPGATKTRRTVVETVVTTRDEVLIHYGIGLGFRPRPLTPEYDEQHRGAQWVPVDELRGRKGKRYFRIVCGHGDWSDIPVDG